MGNIDQVRNYTIDLDHELRIVKYRHAGNISAEDIEAAWGDFLAKKEFTQLNYNLLSDYRDSVLHIPLSHLPEIIKFMRAIEHVVRGKKQALILNDSYSVAGSTLFKDKVYKEIGFKVRIFATEAAALDWLLE